MIFLFFELSYSITGVSMENLFIFICKTTKPFVWKTYEEFSKHTIIIMDMTNLLKSMTIIYTDPGFVYHP